MTRIIAISDTHLERVDDIPERLMNLAKGADMVLHAGDFVTLEVYRAFNELGNLEAVCGNSDSSEVRKTLPERRIIEVENVRLGLIHQASYSYDLTGVDFMAREMGVDALVFGHIHRPHVKREAKLLLCPGSPIEPRMSPPTVVEIVVAGDEIKGQIIPLGEATCNYIKYAEAMAMRK